ncbi:MAG: hypothetical protein SGARI_001038 [Bacillariaceae sp.]
MERQGFLAELLIKKRCRHAKEGTGGGRQKIPHDSYLKMAQLERLKSDHDVVMIDEAQDMTPCQADLFWGSHVRQARITFLFGDKYQQLYRFRGASNSFRHVALDRSASSFSLTGSFRFGKNIANTASLVLGVMCDEALVGRRKEPGTVHMDCSSGDNLSNRLVLCRTNNGILRYVFNNRPRKWCYLDNRSRAFPPIRKWARDLEASLQVEIGENGNAETSFSKPFSYGGEIFKSPAELSEYAEDEEDNELTRYMGLLVFLKGEGTSLDEFSKQIKRSFVPATSESMPSYDGAVMATVHMAKGSEFQRVIIHNDFAFDIMKNEEIAHSRREDELNAFYVALTRAQKHLYLCPSAADFLRELQAENPEIAFAAEQTISLKDQRQNWSANWVVFKADTATINHVDDVPWPLAQCDDDEEDEDDDETREPTLLLDSAMTELNQKRFLRTLMLIFHPDKFLPRYQSRICEDELVREAIRQQVYVVFELIRKALCRLRNPGDDA